MALNRAPEKGRQTEFSLHSGAGLRPHIAYLVSEYPHIRHAYLLREIRGLRAAGWNVQSVAVRPDARQLYEYTAEEREERRATFYILHSGAGRIAWAHLSTFCTRPLRYLAGLGRALSYGRFHPGRTLSGLFYFAEAVIAGWWISGRGISHVHTHYLSTVAWIMERVFPLRISMSIHGSGEFDDPANFRLAEKIQASEFIRAISYFGRSQLMRAAPQDQWKKIQICRLGVDPELFQPRPFRLRPEPFELICVGGMARPRAFHVLLHSLAILVAGGHDVILRLVGDGPDRSVLEELAHDLGIEGRVVFEGWKDQDQLRGIYARADVFVFSSFAEGIPVVLMEAMAMEIPCVASRITGIPELIRDGVDGLLAAPSDHCETARAIAQLIEDPALRRRFGESARARILELYDLNRNIIALSELFLRGMA